MARYCRGGGGKPLGAPAPDGIRERTGARERIGESATLESGGWPVVGGTNNSGGDCTPRYARLKSALTFFVASSSPFAFRSRCKTGLISD